MTEPKTPSKLRTLLLLARASNLPTVWSNCLAGWILGGGEDDWVRFFILCVGATFLYVGGMFLNDAFDADFDRQYRRERPIPSGAISERDVWTWGFVWLGMGAASLFWFGKTTAILSALLMSCIVLYDAIHKKTILSPVLMASCRFFLYLVAASVAVGVNGLAVWSAVVLACYITGLSYIAKAESAPGPLRYWPCILLAAPLVLAYLVNDWDYRACNLAFSLILIVWVVWSLRPIFWATHKNIGASVSALLAGMVWVDLLAVGMDLPLHALSISIFFVMARVFQKWIPAT